MVRSMINSKWIKMLNALNWDNCQRWEDMNDRALHEATMEARQWVSEHVKYLPEVFRGAIKDFFYLNRAGDSHFYHLKDTAVVALSALYAYERELDEQHNSE